MRVRRVRLGLAKRAGQHAGCEQRQGPEGGANFKAIGAQPDSHNLAERAVIQEPQFQSCLREHGIKIYGRVNT